MKRIVLTGANGYLANVIRLYNEDKYEFIRITRNDTLNGFPHSFHYFIFVFKPRAAQPRFLNRFRTYYVSFLF